MKESLAHLPSLPTVIEGIEKFKKISFEEINLIEDSTQAIQLIDKILKDFDLYYCAFIARETSPDNSFALTSYRVREADQVVNRFLISEFSFCPVALCKATQRANFEHHPVLYASDSPQTALIEVQRNKHLKTYSGGHYYIARWDIPLQEKFRYTSLTYNQISPDNFYSSLNDNFEDRLKQELGYDLNEDQISGQLKLLEFYSSLFLSDYHRNVSAYIAHRFLYHKTNQHCEILMYPSVQTNRLNLNFAIHPNTVHAKCKLKYVYEVRLKESFKLSGSTTVELLSVGVQKNGFIHWFRIEENENNRYVNQFKKDMKMNLEIADLELEDNFYQYS